MEKLITSKQIGKLHALLYQTGLMDSKRELILQVTNHRTDSSKELLPCEITRLINHLEENSGLDGLRRKVFALAYSAGIIYGDTPEDKKMNAIKLNKFIAERGAIKKEISKMTKPELLKTVGQFAVMVKHNVESQDKKNAMREVNSLLNELNLNVK